MTTETIETAAHDLFALLPLLNRLMAAEVRREVGDTASGVQLRVLTVLQDGPQTLSSLARHQHVSPQALSDVTHALVQRGWVQSTTSQQDRRKHVLELTPAGRVACATTCSAATQQVAQLLQELTPAELAAVHVALPALQRVLTHTVDELALDH